MLDKLTVGDFQTRVGETFRVESQNGPLALVLAEARDLAGRLAKDGPLRAPFSLLFRGPLAPVLPQRIYALENDALGRLEIFLVPIGPDAGSMRYEAIFN